MRAGVLSLPKAKLKSDHSELDLVKRGRFWTFVSKVFLVGMQLLGLIALSMAGHLIVHELQLPIPGSLVGMITLFMMLWIGVVRVSWFDRTSSFLIKHLAFFFIPITVGLMDSGAMLAESGLVIIGILIASAAIGVSLSAMICQALIIKSRSDGDIQ